MRDVLWEKAMKVYNAAQRPIVVRSFAARQMSEPGKLILIPQGESHNVYGPALPEFGLCGPYLLIGDLLVRDWGPLRIIPDENNKVEEIFLNPGSYGTYKQSFALKQNLFEGVFVAFFNESMLVGM